MLTGMLFNSCWAEYLLLDQQEQPFNFLSEVKGCTFLSQLVCRRARKYLVVLPQNRSGLIARIILNNQLQ